MNLKSNDSTATAEAPATESSTPLLTEGRYAVLKVKDIKPSKTNPRKCFDGAALWGLAQSIAEHGLLQPISVQPLKGETFEIILGERRWRAGQLIKQDTIRAFIYEGLTANQVEQIQWIENLQRQDLNPIEESDGYIHLMESFYVSIEDIAKKVGKPRKHVAGMIALAVLPKAMKDAVAAGNVAVKNALLFARVHDKKSRDQAVKLFFDAKTRDLNRSHADIARELIRACTLDLDQAPFDPRDTGLLPTAGPCLTCPKLAKNDQDLFADAPGNRCTDPTCYGQKLDALWERTKKDAEEIDQCVMPTEESSKLFAGYDQGKLTYEAGQKFMDLDAEAWVNGSKKTWRELFGAKLPPKPVIARGPDGSIHHLLPKRDAINWAAEHGLRWAKELLQQETAPKRSDAERAKAREAVQREKARKETLGQLAKAIAKKLGGDKPGKWWKSADFWRKMIVALLTKSYSDEIRYLVAARGWKVKGEFPGSVFEKNLKKLHKVEDLRVLFWELFMLTGAVWSNSTVNHGKVFASLLNVSIARTHKNGAKQRSANGGTKGRSSDVSIRHEKVQ